MNEDQKKKAFCKDYSIKNSVQVEDVERELKRKDPVFLAMLEAYKLGLDRAKFGLVLGG